MHHTFRTFQDKLFSCFRIRKPNSLQSLILLSFRSAIRVTLQILAVVMRQVLLETKIELTENSQVNSSLHRKN